MRLSLGYFLTEYLSKNYSKDKLKCNQILALIVTFLVYVVYRMSRRSISVVKPEFNRKNCSEFLDFYSNKSNETNPHWCNWAPFDKSNAVQMLGWLDSSFLIAYAVFMFVSGYVAERCDLRYFLTISLIICGIFNILFGIAYQLEIHNYYYFIAIQVLTGVAQTTGWPAILTVVGNWFGKSKKGLIFGIWSWHTSVGNIVGSAVAGVFVDYNWGLSFIVPGIICIGMAIIVFLFLIPGPQYIGLSLEDNQMDKKRNDKEMTRSENGNISDSTAISFLGALKLPGVIEFSVCQFFAKLVSFTFMYWLPELINKTIKVSPSESAYLSISFDIGGATGAMLAGYLADKTDASALTCIIFLVSAIPSLLFFYEWGAVSLVSNQCLQFIAGMFVNGPYSLISTAVAADLGTRIQSKNALATVSSIIEGTGCIGAATGPTLAGYLDDYGWNYVFYMVMLSDLFAALTLIRTGINEFRRLSSERKEKQINRYSYKL